MAKKDLSNYDVSERQREVLDYVLEADRQAAKAPEERVGVKEARGESTVYEVVSGREATRLLFISKEDSLLNPTSQTLDGYLNMSEVFDEVHIVILRTGIPAKDPVLRVADNAWIYIATANYWWWTPVAALRLIAEQFMFADGFRPDLIVARDPYESALVAYLAGRKYERATQLHVLEDFIRPKFPLRTWRQKLQARLARIMTPRFLSVRTATDQITANIKALYPRVPDIATLPRFTNYEGLQQTIKTIDLKAKYPQFVFTILYVGELGRSSTAFRAIDATRFLLRNPRVGLIIMGDGASRSEFMKRTTFFNIEKQVVFEKNTDEIASYLQAADVLLVTDTDAAADEIALKGAALGIPLVLTHTALRDDLFVDGESALLCDPLDVTMMATNLSKYMSDNALRRMVVEMAHIMVETRLHDDPELYKQAYRNSVEGALVVATEETALVGKSEAAQQ